MPRQGEKRKNISAMLAIYADTSSRVRILTEALSGLGQDVRVLSSADVPAAARAVVIWADHGVAQGFSASVPAVFVGGVLPDIKSGTVYSVDVPIRAGKLVDMVRMCLLSAENQGSDQRFNIAGRELIYFQNILIGPDGPIRLTEKESAILRCLAQAEGRQVSRQTLMDSVWAYVQGVETHTLETHIYRLRQKIEKDPANPKILLTLPDGYALGF